MFELRLMCPEDRVETLSEALDALDALSVSVEDADAQTDAEQALFGEPGMPAPKDGWQRSRVLALYLEQAQAQEALQPDARCWALMKYPSKTGCGSRSRNLRPLTLRLNSGLCRLGTSHLHRRV